MTKQLVTGYKNAPGFGRITGFQKERIRQAWPDVVKLGPLTDRRIEFYRKQGRYGNGILAPTPVKQIRQAKKRPRNSFE
jgi:hypothetical protein